MPRFSGDERQLLDDSLQDFLSANSPFERWRAQPGDLGAERANWSRYAELGWLGIALPESAGGMGGGPAELGIVMAAAGRHLVREGLLGTIVLGAAAIELAGTAAQREALLPRIAAGALQIAFCHNEPDAGYARDYVHAHARPESGGFRITGDKGFALGAHLAGMLVVSARIAFPSGPVALFLVPADAPGVALNVAPSLDGRSGAAVRLFNVRVDAGSVLSAAGEDRLEVIDAVLDRGAIAVCAEACGAMAAATEATIDYLKVREQFGQALARFQVLQHRLVDMSLAAEEARAIVHAALEAIDGNPSTAQRAIWQAKVQTARSARFVGAQGIQLHGGMGMTNDLAIGHLYKRLSVCEALFGDADWYLSRLASLPA